MELIKIFGKPDLENDKIMYWSEESLNKRQLFTSYSNLPSAIQNYPRIGQKSRKTTSISFLRKHCINSSKFSAGSNRRIWNFLFLRSALIIAAPEILETSRSSDFPPRRTATRMGDFCILRK